MPSYSSHRAGTTPALGAGDVRKGPNMAKQRFTTYRDAALNAWVIKDAEENGKYIATFPTYEPANVERIKLNKANEQAQAAKAKQAADEAAKLAAEVVAQAQADEAKPDEAPKPTVKAPAKPRSKATVTA